MARKKKGYLVDGWLILDKPLKMTSSALVSKIKRLLYAKKVGHAGTLDPLATGMLPLALGEATKTIPFVMQSKKSYHFTVQWGIETSTDDTEGKIVQRSYSCPSYQDIMEKLPQFTGLIRQIPPQFSAIKVEGKRAYDLARSGHKFHLEAREVFIEELRIINIINHKTTVFEIVCGKGTYIRSIARDLGRSLGCFGHVNQLRRVKVGPFTENDAWTLDSLEDLLDRFHKDRNSRTPYYPFILPVEAVLGDLLHIELMPAEAELISRGQCITLSCINLPPLDGLAYVTSKGKLLALAKLEDGWLRPKRVFNII
ncbi:MAG: tRNA pseudouridine synthase B [Hyphomicrobiaceae bacterium hypho_1]